MIKAFSYYTDCGHGWVRVQTAILEQLGIINEITGYSYIRGSYAYLEEDCDMTKFHHAYIAHNGYAPKYVTKHTDKQSKIRSYDRFHVSRIKS